jgi:hypothetical protein
MADTYTAQILRTRFLQHKAYVQATRVIQRESGLPIRYPNMPEDISENMVKFIIHTQVGDTTSKWVKAIKAKGKTLSGDLVSEKEGTQECKCFTSDGPPSFGPKEKWNVIYFLDARKWLDDSFECWRIPLANDSAEWKAIKMNKKKNETHEDQSNQGRRPRITWESLYPQISAHCTKIYSGSFEGIFTTPVSVSALASSSTVTEGAPIVLQ